MWHLISPILDTGRNLLGATAMVLRKNIRYPSDAERAPARTCNSKQSGCLREIQEN